MSKEQLIKLMKKQGFRLIYGADHTSPTSIEMPINYKAPKDKESAYFIGHDVQGITKQEWDEN